MKRKNKELSLNIALFTVARFFPKMLTFLLVPLYTTYLSPSDYGISEIINTTVQLLLPILTVDIQDAILRFSLDKNYKPQDVLSTGLKTIFTGSIILAVALTIIAFLPSNNLDPLYLVFLAINFFSASIMNTLSMFCRGINKVKIFTISSIINSAVTLIANIILLVVLKWGLFGYLLANCLGSLTAIVLMFFGANIWDYITINVDQYVGKEMYRFSFPLIFSCIGWWVTNASDRYLISAFLGVSVSGIYAVAYKIPSILTVFQDIVAQAWSMSVIKEFDRKDVDGFISNTYNRFNVIMILVASSLIVFNIPISKILFSNDFFKAWEYVPPLLVSVTFNAMALFLGSVYTAVKDTKTLSYSTITGALVNIILTVVLVVRIGAYGAALATAISHFIVFFIRHIFLKNYIELDINVVKDGLGYTLLIIQMFLAFFSVIGIFLQVFCLLGEIFLYREQIKLIVFQGIRTFKMNLNKR